MKATVEIPEDVAEKLLQRAQQSGRRVDEQVLSMVEFALQVPDATADELQQFLQLIRRNGAVRERIPFQISVDERTGLPLVKSPPDAPIRSMTCDQLLALEYQTQLEEDLERAGIAIRR